MISKAGFIQIPVLLLHRPRAQDRITLLTLPPDSPGSLQLVSTLEFLSGLPPEPAYLCLAPARPQARAHESELCVGAALPCFSPWVCVGRQACLKER